MSNAGHELKGPHFILSSEGELHGEDTVENRETVRRIHACVNACAGITTEELEQGIVQDMRRAIADVVPLLQTRQQGSSAVPQTKQPIVIDRNRTARRPLQDV